MIKHIDRLDSCHPDLQKLLKAMGEEMDLQIIFGYRDETDQNEAYRRGNTSFKFPNSKHNLIPSMAVDAAHC